MAIESVWVVAEPGIGGPSGLTLELLTGARGLSPNISVFTWGGEGESAAALLGSHGAKRVYDIGDLGRSLPGPPVARALAERIGAGEAPDVVLVGATYDGRDVAGRLSARLDRPVLTNVVDLSAEDDQVVSHHLIFGGEQAVTARFTGPGPQLFVVRSKSFPVEATGGSPAEVIRLEAPDTGTGAVVVERHLEEQQGPKLDEAEVVVSGGRGLGGAQQYAMVEELARLLGGAPGASRAIVDAGWVPYAYQVGQTGKTVKPTLYLACGISGATQHLVGMKGAKSIVAINKDPDAPIFAISDLGIVGDVGQVLPRLIDALKARSA
ncbi:MAG: electron transfer flavoprotein subunit alpha/FixB family protein [Acidimicrobiales bacterium]|nr:electron transfer flavoprotein subunit alpha/FixB family protein [Acidimicrobiales bacterium]MBO0894152.1 electron transfer flavoprotein subunit alpha/FixB family protein [Acidimicrobiales bacterium]